MHSRKTPKIHEIKDKQNKTKEKADHSKGNCVILLIEHEQCFFEVSLNMNLV